MPYEYIREINNDSDLLDIVETEIEIEGEKVKIIDKEVWEKMRLIDQLRYLKARIEYGKESFKADLENLKSTKKMMKDDYLVEPYIEFVKLAEEIEKETKGEVEIKTFTGSDGKEVLPDRYCKGFNHLDLHKKCYGDSWFSTLFSSEEKFFKIHLNACSGACTDYCRKFEDAGEYFSCIKDEDPCFCICETAENKDRCKDICNDCIDKCDDEFEWCKPPDYPKCKKEKEKCDNDCEKWKVDKDYCLEYCKDEQSACITSCYNNFLFPCYTKCYGKGCRFCTDQYAGYEECSKAYYSFWARLSGCRKGKYSSSDFFPWDSRKKCLINPLCYGGTEYWGLEKFYGIKEYPQAAKCPSCSSCPECPCLTCSGECGEYAYDDDPLTFYSKIGKTEEEYPGPLTEKMDCDRRIDIPVGRTTDETEKWAEKLAEAIDKFIEKIDDMTEYIKEIGNEKGYCECGSVCNLYEGDCGPWCLDGDNLCWGTCEPACHPPCEFNKVEVQYEEPKTGETSSYWSCFCVLKPCQDNPCQKMINLLKGKKKSEKCPEDIEYKGIKWYHDEIEKALEELKKNLLESRSEFLKMLTYSREKMNECSDSYVQFRTGLEEEIPEGELRERVKLLSCIRAVDEGLQRECYGVDEHGFEDAAETDDWFCCRQRRIKD